ANGDITVACSTTATANASTSAQTGTTTPTLGAANAGNSTASTPAATTPKITPAAVTVTFTAADKPYDGTTTATVSACAIATGKVGTDNVTCTVAGGTFASANASTSAQTVSATATLGGAKASNYTVSNPVTTTAKITSKPVVITPSAGQSKVYAASDPTLTFANDGGLAAGSFTGALARATGESVGSYAISLGTLSAG